MKIKNVGIQEIKRLFSNDAIVRSPLGKDIIVKMILSLDERKQVLGMKSLVSRMQYGEDVSDLCNDIMKVIDTRNVGFKKLLNHYLVRHTGGLPARQLMCVNTFLKDFSDKMNLIRYSAIESSGFLGDGAILKNYVNSLKRCGDSSLVVERCKVADSLKYYFEVDPEMFCKEGLKDLLICLAFDGDPIVEACSLASVREIERRTKILSVDKLRKLFDKYNNSGRMDNLGCLLGLMNNRVEDFSDTTLLMPLLMSCNLWIFYLASSLLISIDSSYKQVVFDNLRGFFDSEDEELYLVLDYAESLIKDVHYENSCFTIYESDKKYNKAKKLGLLFKKLDKVSVAEIKNLCKHREFSGMVLQLAICADHLITEPLEHFSSADDIIKVLYGADKISEKWERAIWLFLEGVSDISEKQKYIYLCGRYSHGIPKEVERIIHRNIPSMTNEVIRFYLNLHRRKILDESTVLEHLASLQKKIFAKDKVKTAVWGLSTCNIHLFDQFCDLKKSDHCEGDDALSVLKTVNIAQDESAGCSILDVKPYSGMEEHPGHQVEPARSANMLKNDISCDTWNVFCSGEQDNVFSTELPISADQDGLAQTEETEDTHKFFGNHSEEENTWLRFTENLQSIEEAAPLSGKMKDQAKLLDTNGLKGVLTIVGKDVTLEVDVLERPQTIYYEHGGSRRSKIIESEGVFPLSRLDSSTIGSVLRLTIKNSIYEILPDVKSFIKPLHCTRERFEDMFRRYESRIFLEEMDTCAVYMIDESSFAFSIFDMNVYGKYSNNGKIVLKGLRKALSLF